MIYDVWVYPVVRVKIAGVEADSQEKAVEKVDITTDFHALLDRGDIEWAEDIESFLVDEQGDTEHKRSKQYDKDYSPL